MRANSHLCRNPDGDVQPWCYIADHEDGIYWRYCDIPTCQSKKFFPLHFLALSLSLSVFLSLSPLQCPWGPKPTSFISSSAKIAFTAACITIIIFKMPLIAIRLPRLGLPYFNVSCQSCVCVCVHTGSPCGSFASFDGR